MATVLHKYTTNYKRVAYIMQTILNLPAMFELTIYAAEVHRSSHAGDGIADNKWIKIFYLTSPF